MVWRAPFIGFSTNGDPRMRSWLDFWNAPNRIYVNDRHREAHYERTFTAVKPYLPKSGTVLDWGCGEALAAERMAARGLHVLLYDGAEAVRARLRPRIEGHEHIDVLDDDALAALSPQSIDLILIVSVVQYLDRHQLDQTLGRFYALLTPEGALLLGDVIEPDTPILKDVHNLLRFAYRERFLLAALLGLGSTFVSRYRKLRHQLGFSRYTPAEIESILRSQGFSVQQLTVNIAPSRHRRSFLARKIPRDAASAPKDKY
jgi:2-polyprenyl-3-methyl-5-hydroxy-6-metoxy-1,4-benzoquinol methylase